MTETQIRTAATRDCPAICCAMGTSATSETFAREPNIAAEDTRARWRYKPPGRTFVAEQARSSAARKAHPATADPKRTSRPPAPCSSPTTKASGIVWVPKTRITEAAS
jgi:hypothetical protein